MALSPRIKHLALVLLLLCLTPYTLQGATVLHVDMDFLLEEATLVIEGEVIDSQAQWSDDNTRITTFITFRVEDTIKGDAGVEMLTLGFAGGTVDDTTLHISGMVYPAVGEKGIYFFEDPSQPMLNPLLGWGQGHFRMRKDNTGQDRIVTEGGAPVVSIDKPAADQAVAGSRTSEPFSHGIAKGVRTGANGQALNTAMDKKQFKDSLKTRLQEKRATKTSGAAQ